MKHFTLISTFTLLLGSSATCAELGAKLKKPLSHQPSTLFLPAGTQIQKFAQKSKHMANRGIVLLSDGDGEDTRDCSRTDSDDPCANSPTPEDAERRKPAESDPDDESNCFDTDIPCPPDDEKTTSTAN
jgi:hypothetical protein